MVPDSLQLLLQAVTTQGNHLDVKTSDLCPISKDPIVRDDQLPSTGALYLGTRPMFLMYIMVHQRTRARSPGTQGPKGRELQKHEQEGQQPWHLRGADVPRSLPAAGNGLLAGHRLLPTRTRLQNSPHGSATPVLQCPECMQSVPTDHRPNPADPCASRNKFSSQPTHIPAVSATRVPKGSAFPSPHCDHPHAICSYVFLVPLPALQLLLEAPSCPQPLLGQVPDPLLHEAEGLLARAD